MSEKKRNKEKEGTNAYRMPAKEALLWRVDRVAEMAQAKERGDFREAARIRLLLLNHKWKSAL